MMRKEDVPPPPPTPQQLELKRKADVASQQAERNYLSTPAGKLWQKHKDWDRQVCQAIVNHKILVGMTPDQVRTAWGRPERINRTVIPGRVSEQWVYGTTYLYFDDGILTSWQDSR